MAEGSLSTSQLFRSLVLHESRHAYLQVDAGLNRLDTKKRLNHLLVNEGTFCKCTYAGTDALTRINPQTTVVSTRLMAPFSREMPLALGLEPHHPRAGEVVRPGRSRGIDLVGD